MQQITSLRGLAIVLIILFHLCPQYLPYGYFGVEVFLVISGFLLMRSFQKQGMQIGLVEFASKKVMRLFVPVAVVVPLTLLAALWFQDYQEVGRASVTGAHTLVGNANRFLDRVSSNYFAADSATNPFLHMWYLAVTVHVYVLFALGCVLYRFLPRRVMLALLWVVGVGSFLWAYSYPLHECLQAWGLPVWEQVRPVSHYMTLPRLWEPLAGVGLACIYCNTPPCGKMSRLVCPGLRGIGCLLGLLCILAPALARGEQAALCPALVVVGTCLLIRFGEGGAWMRVLNNRLLLWVGTISYSLYLVHMPLISFYRSWFLQAPDAQGMVAIALLALGLGYLFYLLVEKRKVGWVVFALLYVFAMGLCVLGRQTHGFKDYVQVEVNQVELPLQAGGAEITSPDVYAGYDKTAIPYSTNIFAFVDPKTFNGSTEPLLMQLGEAGKVPTCALIGDSHAAASFPGLNALCREIGVSGVYVTSVVMPFWDWNLPPLSFEKSYYCDEKKVRALLAWLEQHPEIRQVVISHYWTLRYRSQTRRDWQLQPVPNEPETYVASLAAFVAALQERGKEVVLIAPFLQIEAKDVVKHVRTNMRRGIDSSQQEALQCTREQYMADHGEVVTLLEQVAERQGCTLVQTLGYIPEEKPFSAYDQGEILYKDRDHMTSTGSERMFRYLRPQLEKVLKPAEAP